MMTVTPRCSANSPTEPGLGLLDTERQAGGGGAQLETAEIGRYAILGELGAGGMGVVYAAYDPRLGRRVAIKVLRGAGSDAGQERLEREAQAMARVSHPNVVPVFDVGLHLGEVFISMEYIEGKPLNEELAAEENWRARLALVVAAARGLAAAHKVGLVHGDFKPHNILVGSDGRVRVMDFGLARSSAREPTPKTTDTEPMAGAEDFAVTRGLYGTPAYMAPEQFNGEFATEGSDQFSLCVSIYEALHGSRPFRGRSSEELANNVTAGRLDLESRAPRIPDWLNRVVVRGLAVDPTQRWGSVSALLDELERDPTTRRRRIFGAGVLAFATLAAGSGWATHSAMLRANCEATGREIDATWNAESRSRVRAAIMESGAVNAEELVGAVLPTLDSYAAEWNSLRQRACLAVRVERTLDVELAAQSRACFEDGRVGFDASLEFAEHSDATEIQNAVRLVLGLPDVGQCVHAEELRRRVPLGENPEAASSTASAIVRAEVLREGGNAAAAATGLRQALEQHGEKIDPRLRARVLYSLGRAETDAGDLTRGAEHLLSSVQLAIEHRDDRTVVDAAGHLAYAIAHAGAEIEQGRHWATIARLHLSRLVDEPLREAALDRAEAALFFSNGDIEEARASCRHALATLSEALGESHPKTLQSLLNTGMVEGVLGNRVAAKEALDRVVAQTTEIYGASHPQVALALEGLAGSELDAGQPREAARHYREAVSIRRHALGPEHPDTLNSAVMLASAEGAAGNREAAIVVLREATVAQARVLGPEHREVAVGRANLARLLTEEGQLDEARPLLEKSIAIQRKLSPEGTINLGIVINSLGAVERRAKNYGRAIEIFTEAANVLEVRGGAMHPTLAFPLMGRGCALVELGRYEEARPDLERALAIRSRERGNEAAEAVVRFHLARALWGLGKEREAASLARSSLAVLKKQPRLERESVAMVRDWLQENSLARSASGAGG